MWLKQLFMFYILADLWLKSICLFVAGLAVYIFRSGISYYCLKTGVSNGDWGDFADEARLISGFHMKLFYM